MMSATFTESDLSHTTGLMYLHVFSCDRERLDKQTGETEEPKVYLLYEIFKNSGFELIYEM